MPTDGPLAGRDWSEAVPHPVRVPQGQRAGLVSRGLAAGVDLGVLLAGFGACYLAVAFVVFATAPVRFSFPQPSRTVVVVTASVLSTGYLAISWATTGRTVGDMVLGLRVLGRRGGCPHLVIAVLRALCCLVLPIGLALAAGPAHRSLADTLLRTSVVYDWIPAHVTPNVRGAPGAAPGSVPGGGE